jgi:predicted O-methyltransferase YrrM
MKSTDGLSPRRKQVWNLLRPFIPERVRWFYEGHPQLHGQLWYAERKLLYETIRRSRPAHCFEIGTWRGGGSTLFISRALSENAFGKLHTIEIDREFYENAVHDYTSYLPSLLNYVEFHFGDFRTVYSSVLEKEGTVDFLILDGAEDGQQTLEQYSFFLPYMKPGTILMVHDWLTAKTELLKPILENSDVWEIQRVLTPPDSVGFVLALRKQ